VTTKILGRCSWRASEHTSSHLVQCLYAGKVVEDGKLWCNIHKPSKRQARADTRHDQWEERWAKEAADRRAIACFPELLAAAIDLYHNMGEPQPAEWERLRLTIAKAKGEG